MSKNNIFCGIGNTPKGKKLGTAKQCLRANQVRRYGIEKIDPKLLLKKDSRSKNNLVKEQLKLMKLETRAKLLIKNINEQKFIINSDQSTKKQKDSARKKGRELMKTKNILVKKISTQQNVVKSIDKSVFVKKKPPVKKVIPYRRDPELQKIIDENKYKSKELQKIINDTYKKLNQLEKRRKIRRTR